MVLSDGLTTNQDDQISMTGGTNFVQDAIRDAGGAATVDDLDSSPTSSTRSSSPGQVSGLTDSMKNRLEQYAQEKGLNPPKNAEDYQILKQLMEVNQAEASGGGFSVEERLRATNGQDAIDRADQFGDFQDTAIADDQAVTGSGYENVTNPAQAAMNKIGEFGGNLFSLRTALIAVAVPIGAIIAIVAVLKTLNTGIEEVIGSDE